MINLLPQEYSSAMRLDRLSATLYKWMVGAVVAIAGLVFIIGAGWLYLNEQTGDLNHSIVLQKQQLQSQNLSQVQKNADQLSGNIKIINQILSKEIRFSDLIQAIGQVMPNGSVLSSLSLSKIGGGIDLSASTKDYSSAAQIATNLSDPSNNIFSKVDVVTVTCTNGGLQSNVGYSCNATYRALFDSKTPSRFFNVPKDGS
jgi:Tfp pilus assembly protein PilN